MTHYTKVYMDDLENDEALNLCSDSAWRFWVRMLLYMDQKSPQKGYLLKRDGGQPSLDELSLLFRMPRATVIRLLAELESRRVFGRIDGKIVCRRQVRQAHLSALRSESGKLGVNAKRARTEENNSRDTHATSSDVGSSASSLLQQTPQHALVSGVWTHDPYSYSDPDPEKSTTCATADLAQLILTPTRAEPPTPEQVREIWNASAKPAGLPCVERLTDKRRAAVRTRLREPGRDESWVRRYVARIAATAFLRGESERGWRADFDWAFRSEDNIARVLEGKYDSTPQKRPESTTARLMRRAVEQRQVELAEEAAARNGSNGVHGPPPWDFDDPPLQLEGGL